MAVLSITVNDNIASRVNDAFAAEFGWSADLGMTKGQFTKSKVIEYIKQVTRNYEANIAANTARQTKDTEVNAFDIT